MLSENIIQFKFDKIKSSLLHFEMDEEILKGLILIWHSFYLCGMCTGTNRLLSQLGAEKIVFLYFYNSVFCSLADKLTDKIFIE